MCYLFTVYPPVIIEKDGFLIIAAAPLSQPFSIISFLVILITMYTALIVPHLQSIIIT